MVRKRSNTEPRWRQIRTISQSQSELIPGRVIEDKVEEDPESGNRRYSNLLDLPDVNLNASIITIPDHVFSRNHGDHTVHWVSDHPPGNLHEEEEEERNGTPWLDRPDINQQDKRFYNDFRPFFFLCQISGLFPQVLSWNLPFAWCYWGTIVSMVLVIILSLLFVFYLIQVGLTIKTGLLFVSYNLAWLVHISHSIDWILLFFLEQKTFEQIWQGYRKFYRYLLADRSDQKVIRFTWKTFIGWEIMFYITAAALVLKSYSDRFIVSEFPPSNNTAGVSGQMVKYNKSILATIDQLALVQNNTSQEFQNFLFWLNLFFNIVCLNIVFLSEVFFMMLISVIFHAFFFLHKQIDEQLGNPDSVFNVEVIHDPMTDLEDNMDQLVRNEIKSRTELHSAVNNKRCPSTRSLHRGEQRTRNNNVAISIRALWEQMEELIDLLDQVNSVFGMTLQFLALEYLIFFPALLYFCIELYPTLSTLTLGGFLTTSIILGIRSFVFTFVCARVHKETQAPINTLYRAYVKGDVSWHDYDLIYMFISRLSTSTIAVRTWSHVPITRQTFSIIFISVFGILAILLQSQHINISGV